MLQKMIDKQYDQTAKQYGDSDKFESALEASGLTKKAIVNKSDSN